MNDGTLIGRLRDHVCMCGGVCRYCDAADEIERLREVMRTVSIECAVFHHAKKDRHTGIEDCPVAKRFRAALGEDEDERTDTRP